jgi:hypothetical protein
VKGNRQVKNLSDANKKALSNSLARISWPDKFLKISIYFVYKLDDKNSKNGYYVNKSWVNAFL